MLGTTLLITALAKSLGLLPSWPHLRVQSRNPSQKVAEGTTKSSKQLQNLSYGQLLLLVALNLG